MKNKKNHLFLKNQSGKMEYFNTKRFIDNLEVNEEELPIKNYEASKNNLKNYLVAFLNERNSRRNNRTINVPHNIEYIKINFYKIFDKNLSNFFRSTYGMSPIIYDNFNYTVLFAIQDEDTFTTFINHLNSYINSEENEGPHGTEYSRIILINDFIFLSTNEIMKNYSECNKCVLKILDNFEIFNKYQEIITYLSSTLDSKKIKYKYSVDYKLLEIFDSKISDIKEIVDNFDIVYSVQSNKTTLVKPSKYGQTIRSYDFEINTFEDNPLVGILDTGVSLNTPLRSTIKNFNYDIVNETNPTPIIDSCGHGTAISSIVCLGEEFYNNSGTSFNSFANIVPIKILETDEGEIDITKIADVIRKANSEHNIRLFCLSVNLKLSKKYNTSVSDFGYVLDNLTSDLDILIFISIGNLSDNDIIEMQNNKNDLHKYPNHYYNPFLETDQYNCEMINMSPPSDSYNNISVGAIADNLNSDSNSDLTLDKILPAYYSRKFNYDYSKKINNAELKYSIINRNLYKPDIVNFGGDALKTDSQMKTLDVFPSIYSKQYGTSLSNAFACNIAAKILKSYPKLNMQTVKALIINFSNFRHNFTFLESLISSIKDSFSARIFDKKYEELERNNKLYVSRKFNSERLLSYIAGNGKPIEEKCLFSSDDSITFIIEDVIKHKEHKALIINIPDSYCSSADFSDGSRILKITATLCYKFKPIRDNHLAYCPIHISFGLFKVLDDNIETNTDRISRGKLKENNLTKKQTSEIISLNSTSRWSEDFYPKEDKLFSNCQKSEHIITKKLLIENNNKLSLAFRCICKQNLEESKISYINNRQNPFSLILNISEIPHKGEVQGLLYNEIININTIESIIEVEGIIEL